MDRYKTTPKIKHDGKSYYRTTTYQNIPERNDDMYFISQEGDRCDMLAQRFYGDPELWWFIAKVNQFSTMNIPKGISLRIPSMSTMKRFLNY